MKNNSKSLWLIAQLPAWRASGKIEDADGKRLRLRCIKALGGFGQTSLCSIPLAIAALLFIGAAWLVFEYWGWDGLGMPLRAAIASAPWLITSITLVWAYARASSATVSSAACEVREACALLHGIGSGLTLGLLHTLPVFGADSSPAAIGADPQSIAIYVTAWLVMQLPLLPLTRSVVMTYATLLAIIANYQFLDINPGALWSLFVLWTVFAAWQLRWLHKELPHLAVGLLWAFIVSLLILLSLEIQFADLIFRVDYGDEDMSFIFTRLAMPMLLTMLLFYSTLMGVGRLYLTQYTRQFNYTMWSRPFEVVGGALCVLALYTCQNVALWQDVGNFYFSNKSSIASSFAIVPSSLMTMTALTILGSLYILFRLLRSKDYRILPFALTPWVIMTGVAWTSLGLSAQVLALAISLYLALAIGAWMVAIGTKTGRHTILDAGTCVLLIAITTAAMSTSLLGPVAQILLVAGTAAGVFEAHFACSRIKVADSEPR